LSMSAEAFSGRRVLDAVSIGENHEGRVSCGWLLCRSRRLRNARIRKGSSVRSSERGKLGNAPDRYNGRIYRGVGE
jgi:hypothetical protein